MSENLSENKMENIALIFAKNPRLRIRDVSKMVKLSRGTIKTYIHLCKKHGLLPKKHKAEWTEKSIKNTWRKNGHKHLVAMLEKIQLNAQNGGK